MPAIRARVVQISDLHVNRNVKPGVTGMLKQILAKLDPHPNVLIVSGDLANQPVPWQMKRAAQLVREIRTCCGAERVIVIPGNHDFKFWGNIGLRRFTRVPFEIYFRRNGLDRDTWWRIREAWKLRFNALGWKGKAMREAATLVDVPGGIAVFTINSNTLTEMMAAGKVESLDLRELYDLFDKANCAPEFAFRYKIVVVHHHAAPIANAPADVMARLQDSFMMFYNAGLFVQELSRRGFNLVLHGHRHVAGFVRLGCEFPELGRTVLPIAAAGTACHPAPDDSRGHHLQVIDILDDDTAKLYSWFFSGDVERKDESYTYDLDLLRDVARRRYFIFQKIQQRNASEVRKIVTITNEGYTAVEIDHVNCRARTAEGFREIPLSLVTERPSYLRGVDKTAGASSFVSVKTRRQTLYRVEGVLDLGMLRHRDSGPFNFGYQYRLMNGHVLTPDEFARHYAGTNLDSEYASITCDVACDRMVLTVQFPPENDLDSLEVRAIANYVPAPLTGIGDERLDRGDAVRHDGETERISAGVRREAAGYTLSIPDPVPGTIYQLCWNFRNVPQPPPPDLQTEAILEAKRALISMAADARNGKRSLWDRAAAILTVLAGDVDVLLPGDHERFEVTAMVFDDEKRRLKFIAANGPVGNMPSAEFFSGEGCAGYVFEKGRHTLYHPKQNPIGYFIRSAEWHADEGLSDPAMLASFPWIANALGPRPCPVGVVNLVSAKTATKLLPLVSASRDVRAKSMQRLQDAVDRACERLLQCVQEPV